MKAAYKANRNKGIEVRDVPIPKISSNEVLVKVKKAAICGTDIHLYEWNNWCENVNAKNPIVIGHEFCGEVVEVGSNVNLIKEGDLVAGETHIPCGHCIMCKTGKQHICQNMKIIGVHTDGAFAEYIKIPEICAWKLPKDTPPEVGAIYEPFGIAVHAVLKCKIANQSVAIIGCGPIGLFAVNVASISGTRKVFAVDVNKYRLDIAKKMGNNVETLNPAANNDVNKIIKEETKGYGADVVIELSGSVKGIQMGFEILKKTGNIILVGLASENISLDLVNNVIYKEATIYGVTGREMFDTWYMAEKLIRSGKCNIRDVLTHKFVFNRIREAILIAKEGNCGKPIIEIS